MIVLIFEQFRWQPDFLIIFSTSFQVEISSLQLFKVRERAQYLDLWLYSYSYKHGDYNFNFKLAVNYINIFNQTSNTYCHLIIVSPYFGQWIDMSCSSFYHGICQFFPNGEPKIEEVVLPPKSGCKPGWWKFGGYCYLDFGYMDNSNQPKVKI